MKRVMCSGRVFGRGVGELIGRITRWDLGGLSDEHDGICLAEVEREGTLRFLLYAYPYSFN
jgi:hypothetical protein